MRELWSAPSAVNVTMKAGKCQHPRIHSEEEKWRDGLTLWLLFSVKSVALLSHTSALCPTTTPVLPDLVDERLRVAVMDVNGNLLQHSHAFDRQEVGAQSIVDCILFSRLRGRGHVGGDESSRPVLNLDSPDVLRLHAHLTRVGEKVLDRVAVLELGSTVEGKTDVRQSEVVIVSNEHTLSGGLVAMFVRLATDSHVLSILARNKNNEVNRLLFLMVLDLGRHLVE